MKREAQSAFYSFLFTIFLGIFLAGCSSPPVATLKQDRYDVLVIRPLSLEHTKIEDINQSNLEAYSSVKAAMVKEYERCVIEHLKPLGLFREILILDNTEEITKKQKALVLQTKLSEIQLGSAAKRIARYFTLGIPFAGTGQTRVEAIGRMVDGQTGNILEVSKNQTNTSWYKGSLEDTLISFTKELSLEYAELVESYMTTDEPVAFDSEDNW